MHSTMWKYNYLKKDLADLIITFFILLEYSFQNVLKLYNV
jgi:hypothetical protein